MKKALLYYIFACIALQTSAQTWQATKLTSVAYLPVTGIQSHKNDLFATVFNGFAATFEKLNSNDTSWTAITPNNITGVPRFMASTGNRLYLSTVVSGVVSMVYYSTDGGNNFIVDTIGLPQSFGSVGLVAGLHYHHGKVIANLGGSGYFLKDTSATNWTSINVPTALNGGIDPIAYFGDTLFAYDNTGTNTLYVSGNWGTSWMVRTSDLPVDFGTNRLVANDSTGRLYAAGAWSSSTMYGLYYSDNNGINWTLQNLSNFMSLNYNGTQQLITAIYASGQTVYLALENNKNPSAPDIIGSTTGLANLAYDTLGLPTNAVGGVYGVKFLTHKNKLVLSLNVIDVYIKGAGSTSGIQNTFAGEDQIILFPNPGQNNLHVNNANNVPLTQVNIINSEGKTVLTESLRSSDIDITELPKGIYFIQLFSDQTLVGTEKFIRD